LEWCVNICEKVPQEFVEIIIEHPCSFPTYNHNWCRWSPILTLGKWLFIMWYFLWANLGRAVLASCKHLYHPSCAIVHFNTSTKRVDPLCLKEMHDSWWLCSGIKKPRCTVRRFKFKSTLTSMEWPTS
jgi:hypothetical protein